MAGAKIDLVELGGGSASSTVISPKLFEGFVAPYDSEMTALAHQAGQRIVYHTCGGIDADLEKIAAIAARRHGNLHARRHGRGRDLQKPDGASATACASSAASTNSIA